jgi:hypothetical protein
MAKQYFLTWFLYDLVGTIPFELIFWSHPLRMVPLLDWIPNLLIFSAYLGQIDAIFSNSSLTLGLFYSPGIYLKLFELRMFHSHLFTFR